MVHLHKLGCLEFSNLGIKETKINKFIFIVKISCCFIIFGYLLWWTKNQALAKLSCSSRLASKKEVDHKKVIIFSSRGYIKPKKLFDNLIYN